MPIKFAAGEIIKSPVDSYIIERLDDVLSQGAFAHSAKAKSVAMGKPVFLKRYFSPTPAVSWYEGFKRHQKTLKDRVSTDPALAQYCYRFIDFFEGTSGRAAKTFHQVFEFVANGKPLSEQTSKTAKQGPLRDWNKNVTYARVMMMGVSALHEKRIVHTDLKPDNFFLVPNPAKADIFHLKIIDLDWAIFSDQVPPWDGKESYIGTGGYMSPEHLRGQRPVEQSDTFTCALMLAQLLTGEHPFVGKLGNDIKLKKAVFNGDYKKFKLPGVIEKINNRDLEMLINQAMSPSLRDRPSSTDIKNVLLGRSSSFDFKPSTSSAPTPSPQPKTTKSLPIGVELLLGGKVILKINIETVVGRQMLKSVHADAQYLAEAQFRLHRSAGGEWFISPMPSTVNETLIDGQKLQGTTALKNGMRIAVGNSKKKVEKLPLVARFS